VWASKEVEPHVNESNNFVLVTFTTTTATIIQLNDLSELGKIMNGIESYSILKLVLKIGKKAF